LSKLQHHEGLFFTNCDAEITRKRNLMLHCNRICR
jgi:hypothetical protein